MSAAQSAPILRAAGLAKSFDLGSGGSQPLVLFQRLDLEVHPGEMVAIMGRSGAGKSTLLHLLAGLEQPSGGEVWLGSEALHQLSASQLAVVRNRRIGYVWQFHYLLPEFTAVENVAMPLLAGGVRKAEALERAAQWLRRTGLSERAQHRSGELSGGEQQRVAIARALVSQPELLLADEPTGDLDGTTAGELLQLLKELCTEHRLAAVLVTHNDEIAHSCNRALQLLGGRLQPL